MDLKDLLEIGSYVAVIGASLVAVYGINTWGREHVGKRRMEMAEDTLASFYEAHDAIKSIRSRLGHTGEGRSRQAAPDESPQRKRKLDEAYRTIERYEKHAPLFSKIASTRYRFQALIGLKESKPFDDLNRVIFRLIDTATQLGELYEHDWGQEAGQPRLRDHLNAGIDARKILFGHGEKEDFIAAEIREIIAEMDSTCRAIIEGHGSRFPLLMDRLTSRRK